MKEYNVNYSVLEEGFRIDFTELPLKIRIKIGISIIINKIILFKGKTNFIYKKGSLEDNGNSI